MNTLSKAVLGLLSSGVVGFGGWGLYHKFGGTNLSKQESDNEGGVNNESKIEFDEEEKAAIEGLSISIGQCNASKKSCTLNSEGYKGMIFSDGTNNDLKIPSNKTVNLTMKKVVGEEEKIFGQNSMKFNLIFSGGSEDIEIQGSNNKKITLKPNTNYEFKKNSQGKLERAWTSGLEMAKKIGFGENSPVGNQKTLPFWVTGLNGAQGKGQTINIIDDKEEKFKNLSPKSEFRSRNLELNEDQEGYNNGFKITAPEEIQFEPQNGIEIKLEKGKNYEILFKGDDWYLSKKNNQNIKS